MKKFNNDIKFYKNVCWQTAQHCNLWFIIRATALWSRIKFSVIFWSARLTPITRGGGMTHCSCLTSLGQVSNKGTHIIHTFNSLLHMGGGTRVQSWLEGITVLGPNTWRKKKKNKKTKFNNPKTLNVNFWIKTF